MPPTMVVSKLSDDGNCNRLFHWCPQDGNIHLSIMTGTPDATGLVYVPVSSRAVPLTRNLWWSATGGDTGADALTRRCIRRYSWAPEYAGRVRTAYRQFLELRRVLEDWDGGIVAPSAAVEDMWNAHMQDPVNYCHDCALLCGRVLGNDADGRCDEPEQRRRLLATRQLLRARYENEVDAEVWGFAVNSADFRKDLALENGHKGPVSEERVVSEVELRQLEAESPISSENRSHNNDTSDQSFQQETSSGPETRDEPDLTVTTYTEGIPAEDVLPRSETADAKYLSVSCARQIHEENNILKDSYEEGLEMIKSDSPSRSRSTNFDIRIRTLKGQVYPLSVNRKTTIQEIKSMIEEEHGTPKKQQYLLFYGKVLEDRRTVNDYNIAPGAGLQLLARSWRHVDAMQEESHPTIAA